MPFPLAPELDYLGFANNAYLGRNASSGICNDAARGRTALRKENVVSALGLRAAITLTFGRPRSIQERQ